MTGAGALFAFNDRAAVRLAHIGRRGTPVAVIDDVFQEPESVAAQGFAQTYTEDPGNLYPGMRATMPESFSTALRAWLTPILQDQGVLAGGQAIQHDQSYFSVVTTASTDLLPIQCIPHYDSTDPNLLAAVIYLCDARFSGTSFYRHRRTGYEDITDENRDNYQLALDHDMRVHGVPRREYMNGDHQLYETVFSNPLKFNGGLVYPGRLLHAGNIQGPFTRPNDRSEWRLTITALMQSA